VKNDGGEVIALGKISDIFATQGVSRVVKGKDNMALFDALLKVQDEAGDKSLTFVNFVDFDQAFGHRRDVNGYSNALHEMDARLPEFIAKLKRTTWWSSPPTMAATRPGRAPTTRVNTSR
jgi:phosphopentomutase